MNKKPDPDKKKKAKVDETKETDQEKTEITEEIVEKVDVADTERKQELARVTEIIAKKIAANKKKQTKKNENKKIRKMAKKLDLKVMNYET